MNNNYGYSVTIIILPADDYILFEQSWTLNTNLCVPLSAQPDRNDLFNKYMQKCCKLYITIRYSCTGRNGLGPEFDI